MISLPKKHRMVNFYLPGTRPVIWKRSRLWQARLWLGDEHGGEVSLGLHPSERAARLFWEEVVRRLADHPETSRCPKLLAVWRILRAIAAERGKKFGVLPKWVSFDGKRYFASVGLRGIRESVGPFGDPESAFLAIWPKVHQQLLRLVKRRPKSRRLDGIDRIETGTNLDRTA